MNIVSSDEKRIVDVGGSDIWFSLYSTVETRLGSAKRKVPLAFAFMKTGKCAPKDGLETARQFNLIRDELSKYPPNKAVYNLNAPKKDAPWKNNLSQVITSCANLYTTSDGKDMLFETVSILTYAGIKGVAVEVM